MNYFDFTQCYIGLLVEFLPMLRKSAIQKCLFTYAYTGYQE